MSTLEVKFLKYPEGVVDVVSYQNAHGGAPLVWDHVSQKYLGTKPFEYMFCTEKLWPLWKNRSVPKEIRAVLGITYDDAVIEKKHFAQAASDIGFFLDNFKINESHVNHWHAIKALLESEPDCDAVGFYWTSVAEDPFDQHVYDEEDELNEECSFDFKRYWSVYAALDGQQDDQD